MSLGSRIRELRDRRGYTQEEMAQHLDMGRANYSRIESDHIEPSASYITLLATKLNTTPNYLLGFTDTAPCEDWIIDIAQAPEHEVNALKEIWATIKKMKGEERGR